MIIHHRKLRYGKDYTVFFEALAKVKAYLQQKHTEVSVDLLKEGISLLAPPKGKKAIADYFKATKDKIGQLELMVHYLETGNQFTVEFGDIDEQFYSSLESMFGRILTELKKQPVDVQEKYFSRIEDVVFSTRNIGWGYYDQISDIFSEYESKTDQQQAIKPCQVSYLIPRQHKPNFNQNI